MAALPAQTGDAAAPIRQNDFLIGLGNIGILRQLFLMVGLAASVAMGGAIVL